MYRCKKTIAVFLAFLMVTFVGCAQNNKERDMASIANSLLVKLRNCDSFGILNMYDTGFAHTDVPAFKIFISESIRGDCSLFNKIIARHGYPVNPKYAYSVVEENGANAIGISLLDSVDSVLNIKKSVLMVYFYPDRFFEKNVKAKTFIRFAIINDWIEERSDKIIMPPKMLTRPHAGN